MPTVSVNLSTDQYVRVTTDPLVPSSLILQSHRDAVRIVFSNTQPSESNSVFHELDGSDDILTIDMTEVAVWALATTTKAKLTATEQRQPVEITSRGGIGVGIYIQDQTTPMFDIKFLNNLGTFKLAVATVPNSRFFTAVAGHSITTGETIELGNSKGFIQAGVIGAVGDIIEIDSIIGDVYDTVSDYNRSTDDMRVDGSVTPVIFALKPDAGQAGDINLIKFGIQDNTDMDFSTFGSAAELTNGCLLRYKRSDGSYENIFNWKTNGGLISHGFDHYFQQKVGGGLFGFLCKVVFNGQRENGVTVRLDGDLNEELQIVVQDDLAGINQNLIEALAQGSGIQR